MGGHPSLYRSNLFQGKRVILPVVLDDTNMELKNIPELKTWKEGAYHILEPKGKIYPEEKYPEIELAVIPGMRFRYERQPVGKRKRLLRQISFAQIPHAYKIGICFDFRNQKTEEDSFLLPLQIYAWTKSYRVYRAGILIKAYICNNLCTNLFIQTVNKG